MKIKLIILFLGLFMLMCNSFAQNPNKISKEIKAMQLLVAPKAGKYINCYYDLRKKSNILREFFPTPKNDTIFILELHGDWSTPILVSRLWSSKKTISYSSKNYGKTFHFSDKQQFTNFMIKLVSEWNIEAIRKEEIENGNMISIEHVFATRIIFNGKKYKIDCISFKDFFNLERDRWR